MKKNYIMLMLSLAFCLTAYAQVPVITHVVDGSCGNDSKFVELYISGTADLNDYKLVRRSNAGTWVDDGFDVDLSSFGVRTDEFIYVIRDLATLNTEFPSANITASNSIVDGGISHNGDDSYRIVEIAGDVVIDQFGGDTDGTGEPWEYVDSWGFRNNDVGPNPTFTLSEWTFNGLDTLDPEGICNGADALELTVTTLGSYTNDPAPAETGEDCSTAFVVDQIPFNASGNTADTGDNYASADRPALGGEQFTDGSGSGNYLNGDDTVYVFTPDSDGVFNFELSGIGTWVGFWLFEGCDPFTSVVAYSTTSSSNTRVFPELNLTGGTTYYVVISTWPTPQSTPYTLDITQITCSTPASFGVSNISVDSADLSWDAVANPAAVDAYTWYVFADGDDPLVDTPVATGSTNDTTVTVSGLTSETAYQAYVEADCGVDGVSELSGAVGFTTPCEPASLDYEQDFTGFTGNLNTTVDCWSEGTGFFDTVSNGGWTNQNFNNDGANAFGTAMYTNLYGTGTFWAASQSIDLGAGSPDNVLSYDVFVKPWSGDAIVTDMGSHFVQVVISTDGGATWDAINTLATYDNANIPNDINNTLETISLAAYSGVVKIGFYVSEETFTPDLRFYIDNLFVGTPPGCLVDEFGQWPTATFTPDPALADGLTVQNITTGGWAGEYSRVNVLDGETYTFSGSIATDYYTISNDAGDTIFAAGLDEVEWVSDADQVIRFWTHTDEDCGFDQAGRTRSVVVGIEPDCLPVTDLVNADVTTTTADFTWTALDNAVDYDWVVVVNGDDVTDPLNHVATGNTIEDNVSVTGLSPSATYQFYVNANCGPGSVGNQVNVVFVTDCDTFVAPFAENFDSGATVPTCWSQNSTTGIWTVVASATFGNTFTDNTSGTGLFAIADASVANQGNDITLTTPFVDVSGLANPAFEFFVHHFKSQGDADNIITVEVWDGAAWNEVYFDDVADVNAWEQVIIDLSSLTITGDVQARFIVDSTPNNFYNDIGIDDVSFDEGPTCFAPTSLVTSSILASSVDFAWDGTTTAVNGYEWAVVEVGVGDIADDTTWADSGATDNATTSATSTLLSPETDYELYVRSNCDTEGFSEWATISFTTTVLCPSPSDLIVDSFSADTASFSWTASVLETGGYEYVVMPDGLDPVVDFADNAANGSTATGITNVDVSGLSSNTTYQFYVLALCDASETSEYVSVTFTTDCSVAALNYEEDFTGFTGNLNTSVDCWSEGTGFFDTESNGGWTNQNFNNDAANAFGTAMYTNLFGTGTFWAATQSIDLGAGSPDNILSYDVFVKPWTGDAVVTDMGTHLVQVVVSTDGGATWDAVNTLVTYDNANIPSDINNTFESISLAAYSGVVKIGFYVSEETFTPDLRFYFDNIFVGVPPECLAPNGLTASNATITSVELAWDAVDNPATEDVYTWYVFADGDDPAVEAPIATGTTDNLSVVVDALESGTSYQAYVEANCGADGLSELSDALNFATLPDFCAGDLFVDSGGVSGDYSINENVTTTITPDNDGDVVTVTFTSFNTEQNYDGIQIYDGPDTTSPLIDSGFVPPFGPLPAGTWTGTPAEPFTANGQTFTSTHPTGALTFVFTSDGSVVRAGWEATVTCDAAPDPVFANVQVIHNSPDPAAASVDVYLDGQLLPALTGVSFREATEFLLAPAGVDFTVDVVPAGGDIADSVFNQTFNLVEDENYIIVANGVLDPTAFITDNGFELTVYTGAQTVAVDPTQVDVLVHHGSPDAPAVDVNESTAGNLVSNIAYPEFQGYLNLGVADYTIEIAAAGSPDALVSYAAPLATLGGFEGTAITIVASGFFGDDAGADNGFGLWVATAAGGPLLELPLVEEEPAPMDPAPTPTEEEVNVISLYSEAYTDVPVDTWLTPWSSAQLADIQIQGNDTKLYTDLDFAGIETVANPIDATEMDFFHIDVWSPNATTFRVKLVDLGAGAVEGEIAFDIAQEEWVSLQIPLADFADTDLVTDPNNLLTVRNSIQQLIISGLPVGDVTAYIDNVYFSTVPTSTVDFSAENFSYYPNPVKSTISIEAKSTVEQVEVFNVLGQRILVERPNQTNPSLNMSAMESGVYLMKVSINGATKTFQIIKD